jgi:hypothetical protein
MAVKAGIYQAQGNLQEAARFLSDINEQIPSSETFLTKIVQLQLERNYGEEIRLLQARLAQFHFGSDFEKNRVQVWLAYTQRLAGDTVNAEHAPLEMTEGYLRSVNSVGCASWSASALARCSRRSMMNLSSAGSTGRG